MISVTAIRRRWQCRFGRHQWERCIKESPLGDRHYERCFPCGKERGR